MTSFAESRDALYAAMIAAPSNTGADWPSKVLAELSKAGYELVKRDPFTSVGLTPPVFTVAFEDGPAGHLSVTFTHVSTSRVFHVPADEHRIVLIDGLGYALYGSGVWDSLTGPPVPENEDLDRVGKLAARVSELESDRRIMSGRLASIEHWLDREDHGWATRG